MALLLERGVIMKEKKRVAFPDGLPPAVVDEYQVPLPIHIRWCEWASHRYQGLR